MVNWRAEYPFHDRFQNIDGKKYHYVEVGEGEQTVVCVHGNPTWSFYYRSLLTGLKNEARVLAVDHIGCGLSEKPRDYPYTLRQHTDNLIAWLDAMDLRRVVMVVHDWGGAIGLGAAVARPDRVSKLLILNTAAFPPPYIPWRIAACRFPILGSIGIRYFNVFARAATRMTLHRLASLSPTAKAGLLAPYSSIEHRTAIDAFVQDIPMKRSHPTYATLEQLEKDLPKLAHLPIRLVWGMQDWCFRPECLTRFQKYFPQASVRKLEDVGHYVMEEAPSEVLEEMRLLLQQTGTA